MSDLYRLTYVSRRCADCDEAAITEILGTARRNNRARGVTGVLIVSDSGFAQVLEGSQQVLEETFEKIGMDRRHNAAVVLAFEPTEERLFADWAMAHVCVEDEAIVQSWQPVHQREQQCAQLVARARKATLSEIL